MGKPKHQPVKGGIRALTVNQPWASLLALPDGHPDAKRVENRSRWFGIQGPLAIHAAKNGKLAGFMGHDPEKLPFGAVVAIGELIGCRSFASLWEHKPFVIYKGQHIDVRWVREHRYASGPFCLIFSRIIPLPKPIPAVGGRSIWYWEPPASVRGWIRDRFTVVI